MTRRVRTPMNTRFGSGPPWRVVYRCPLERYTVIRGQDGKVRINLVVDSGRYDSQLELSLHDFETIAAAVKEAKAIGTPAPPCEKEE